MVSVHKHYTLSAHFVAALLGRVTISPHIRELISRFLTSKKIDIWSQLIVLAGPSEFQILIMADLNANPSNTYSKRVHEHYLISLPGKDI